MPVSEDKVNPHLAEPFGIVVFRLLSYVAYFARIPSPAASQVSPLWQESRISPRSVM